MRIPLVSVAALDQIAVDTRCKVSWDAMRGDDQIRFCGQCQKYVYNLSEMTAAQVLQIIEEKEGQLCVQLFRRRDGTLITADCMVDWRWRFFKRLRRRRMAWLASLFAMVFMPGCGCPGGGSMVLPDKYDAPSMSVDDDTAKPDNGNLTPPKHERPVTMGPGNAAGDSGSAPSPK